MRLMLNGKLPTKEELAGDELIIQMLAESKEQGKTEVFKDVPTKEKIIQALTVEEVKDLEPVKQMISEATEEAKKSVDRPTIIKELKKEEIENHEVVQSLISESLKKAGFVEKIIQAATDGKVTITTKDGEKKSVLQLMREEQAALSI
jgi:hypothetical protein